MARPRFSNLDPARQDAILAAAAAEFAEHGYAGASVNRIITALGTSKGSLYYYFDDKADLFTTALERALTRIMSDAGWFNLDGVQAEGFWDALLEMTHQAVAIATEDPWWIRLVRAYHRFQSEGSAPEAVARLADFGRSWWRALIEKGQALGVIRTDLPLGLLVETVMGADNGGDRWMADHWEEFSKEELATIIDGRVDLLRDMLDKRNEGWER